MQKGRPYDTSQLPRILQQRICDRYSENTEEISDFFCLVFVVAVVVYFYGRGCEGRGHTQKDWEMSGTGFMM